MNYYKDIKNKLIDDEIYSKVKDYSKERNKVITYFEIGKLLNMRESAVRTRYFRAIQLIRKLMED